MVGVTALVGARLFGGAVGLHAGFVLALSVLPFAYGRAATMDMLLAATTTTAVGLAGLRFLGIAGGLAIPAAAAFAGLATLAGAPRLLLPGLVVGGFVLATRRRRLSRECLFPRDLIPPRRRRGALSAIWRDQGQRFLDVFILEHNVQRTSTIHRHPDRPGYVPVILGGLFPNRSWCRLLGARRERSPGLGSWSGWSRRSCSSPPRLEVPLHPPRPLAGDPHGRPVARS
jgi:hypothetical protein